MAQLTPALKAVALGARTLDAMAPDLTTRLMMRHFMRPRSKPGSDYRSLLPTGAQRLSVRYRANDLTLWCWGKSGPSVLLVHGWEDHSGSMLPFVEPLLALGYKVFTLDAPGHGLSQRSATHLLDCSQALEQVAFEYGPFQSIVAHSFGATAVCLMLSRSQDWHPKHLTLVSPMRDMEQHLQVFADIALLSAERADRLRQRVSKAVGCSLDRLSAFDVLGELAMPGLVIHDRHDPVIPHAVGESVAACWQGSRFVSTSHLGHRRILRCPQVLAEVLALHQN
ncbi:MAG: alpha/beta hydrolase [Congregibacter sp.]|nr:alpha/beta hydrolase [Congregibacter sp.]